MGLEMVIKLVGEEFSTFVRTNKLNGVSLFLLHHEVPGPKLVECLILVAEKKDPWKTAKIINKEEEVSNTAQGKSWHGATKIKVDDYKRSGSSAIGMLGEGFSMLLAEDA